MSIYLGLDSSTQGLKGIVIDVDKGELVGSCSVNFGTDLPDYNCPNGVLEDDDPAVKHSGQQHGSVYLNKTFSGVLAGLNPEQELAGQLAPTLAKPTSPIWMDSSTHSECEEIIAAVGERLQLESGSPAIERFTGPQIRKIFKSEPEVYAATEHIHLVSSFLASVLTGKSVAIDYGDGAGMNLLNLKTLSWDEEFCNATAPGLIARLPAPQPSGTVAGKISPYFLKYGFSSDCKVVVWSGDNPNSLVGMGAGRPGTAVISMGTSDTFFAAMESMAVDPDGCGHVFGNPAGGFMSMVCFTNGSLAREAVKDECGASWDYFDVGALADTAAGNDGNLMLPYFSAESTPLVLQAGVRRSGSPEFVAGKAGKAVSIRAIIEAQALAKRLHSSWIGESFDAIRVTGGASKSPGICRVLADVFQAPIERIAVADSAGLGAAMRAANGVGGVEWERLTELFAATTETIMPDPGNAAVYREALKAYAEFERE